MGFLDDIRAHNAKVEQKLALVQDGLETELFRSIVEGSEITGAPGQPVSMANVPTAGELRDSWTMEKGETETVISTDVSYAPDVEYDLRGQHFTNHGPFSLNLTVAGFSRIVEVVGQRVAESD